MSLGSPEISDFQSHELSFIGSLLPGILHNISTPLSGVIGATQLMEMRASDSEQILRKLEAVNAEAGEELMRLMAKNKHNLDIISRNAMQLIELVQLMVQRYQRASMRQAVPQSLNELMNNELEFLKANLVFKHKVRREVKLADEPFAVKFCYADIIAVVDEFVSQVIERHDLKQGLIEMQFATSYSDVSGFMKMAADYKPREGDLRGMESFGLFLAKPREAGCEHQFDSSLGRVELTLEIPK